MSEEECPIGLPRHGEAADRFRRWRQRHPTAPVGMYDDDRERRRRERRRALDRAPEPLTPEERWARECEAMDDGYLTDDDRLRMAVGGVPELTPARMARMALIPTSAALAILAAVEYDQRGAFVGWPLGLGIAAAVCFALAAWFERKRR